jgi:putative aldouronate transport system substrate-binding protein
LAELKTSIYPIKLGLVDYDKAFPDALKKLNAAGLQKVVAEYDRQFKEWQKSNK